MQNLRVAEAQRLISERRRCSIPHQISVAESRFLMVALPVGFEDEATIEHEIDTSDLARSTSQ